MWSSLSPWTYRGMSASQSLQIHLALLDLAKIRKLELSKERNECGF